MSNNYRELTGREKQRIKKLVTSLCANYDKEYGCLRYRGPQKVIRLFGERRSSGMTELSALAGSEGYAACNDEASVELAAFGG